MEIAKLGIEIAKKGDFDKVTFDGTANWYPSDPIMEQLGYKNSLKLVHMAHEKGLLTYFSAGFRFKHLTDIVQTGTDGIGLGGAQILRFMDSKNGYQDPFKQENVKKFLISTKKLQTTLLVKDPFFLQD
ncbi:conserved domain protein [Limosilactobacillus oris F0423]|uniref:Conserved domain protein n=1 Tax=Limosilactobacillus oris F0423 TaxID=944562 RepID=A0ABN0D3D5_9LACO|nr:conserved domain protein [Limosilactobacillus oris F0423]